MWYIHVLSDVKLLYNNTSHSQKQVTHKLISPSLLSTYSFLSAPLSIPLSLQKKKFKKSAPQNALPQKKNRHIRDVLCRIYELNHASMYITQRINGTPSRLPAFPDLNLPSPLPCTSQRGCLSGVRVWQRIASRDRREKELEAYQRLAAERPHIVSYLQQVKEARFTKRISKVCKISVFQAKGRT
ncbi:hypothetical protein BKA61DRAFT_20665 [Leptodontidium sp. MPI-SDFR-AT-0119]|nr:hypothetical protein BKA61DRAFT_20665 [Leptodontidium sp. MPI-SDFR-AT-0119]